MPDQQFRHAAVLQVDDRRLGELVVTGTEVVPRLRHLLAAAPTLPSWDQPSGSISRRVRLMNGDQSSPSL